MNFLGLDYESENDYLNLTVFILKSALFGVLRATAIQYG